MFATEELVKKMKGEKQVKSLLGGKMTAQKARQILKMAREGKIDLTDSMKKRVEEALK